MATRYCTNCGKALVAGARFCNGCGKAVSSQGANRPAPNPQRNPNQAPAGYHAPQQNPRPNPYQAPGGYRPPVQQPNAYPNPSPVQDYSQTMPVPEMVQNSIPADSSNPRPNTWYPVDMAPPQEKPVVEAPQPPVQKAPDPKPVAPAPVEPKPPVVEPAAAPGPKAQGMSKKEYRKVCTNEKYRKSLRSNAIVLYVLIVLNAVLAIAFDPVMLVDVAIYLALTLGLHLGKSKGCAVGVLCYAILNTIIVMMDTGNFGGWLWLVAGIGALNAFKIADKEYEAA